MAKFSPYDLYVVTYCTDEVAPCEIFSTKEEAEEESDMAM